MKLRKSTGFPYALSTFFAFLLCGALWCIVDVKAQGTWVDFYMKNLRGNFFTGFITVSSFLLSLKIFIVVKLKEGVYDTDEYKKVVARNKDLDKNYDMYKPLKNISNLLFMTILMALTTSVLNVTLALCASWVAILACIFAAALTLCLLLSNLLIIKSNLTEWLSEH